MDDHHIEDIDQPELGDKKLRRISQIFANSTIFDYSENGDNWVVDPNFVLYTSLYNLNIGTQIITY